MTRFIAARAVSQKSPLEMVYVNEGFCSIIHCAVSAIILVSFYGVRGVDILPGNQVVLAGNTAVFNCTSSPWNQAWYFYSLAGPTSPCLTYSYRPHRLNASRCQNLSRYIVTRKEDLLSLSISGVVTSDAGTYVCGDPLTPTSICSAVLGVLEYGPSITAGKHVTCVNQQPGVALTCDAVYSGSDLMPMTMTWRSPSNQLLTDSSYNSSSVFMSSICLLPQPVSSSSLLSSLVYTCTISFLSPTANTVFAGVHSAYYRQKSNAPSLDLFVFYNAEALNSDSEDSLNEQLVTVASAHKDDEMILILILTTMLLAMLLILAVFALVPLLHSYIVLKRTMKAQSSGVAMKTRSVTRNPTESRETEHDEAHYAVVRPTDGADNDDVINDYAYPASPTASAAVHDDSSSSQYLRLLPEPDQSLRLLAVFTRLEADNTISASGIDDDVTNTATKHTRVLPNVVAAADEKQAATYIEIF